jgi:phosphopantothenate-cysteine ligase
VKILITSGGTTEKIDDVRKIKNMSTGRLGTLIAEQFLAQSSAEITYLCSTDAIVPADSGVKIIRIESVKELSETLEKLLDTVKFDAVIHAMAVSDYAVKSVLSADVLDASKTVHEAILNSSATTVTHKKISSDIDNLIIVMEKTPKVIRLFKELQPETVLVGFKLLVDVDEKNLIKTGHDLLLRNQCDFVLANDLTQINGDSHAGLLISPDASVQRFYTKQEIAQGIAANVIKKVGGAQ